MKNVILIILISLFLGISIKAQQSDTVKTQNAQFTFAYPVGTNGINSKEFTNKFSFNVLYGVNGGVNGAEIGSLFNYNSGDVRGAQISGIANINSFASSGVLVSGIANITAGSADGLLMAGIVNYTEKQSTGWQLAGIANITRDTTTGNHLSGILNYSEKPFEGLQISNLNIGKDSVDGVQIGVINYADQLDGFALGVINIAKDSETAIPLGLISIVKNGYFGFEATVGEAIHANLTYKMGVEKLYTVYKVGYSRFMDKPLFSFGIGLGSQLSFSDSHKIAIDVSSNHLIYDSKWNDKVNLLAKADFNYKYQFNNSMSLVIGPSINAYITRVRLESGFGTLDIPYTLFSRENSRSLFAMWVGLNAGVSINL